MIQAQTDSARRMQTMLHSLTIVLIAITPLAAASDYPSWRGPAANGSAPESGARLINDLAEAKKLWICEQELVEGYVGAGWGYRGSYAQPILAKGKLYVPYWQPTGDIFQSKLFATAQKKRVPESHKRKDRWFLDADDKLVCVDARTGAVLWNTACPGGINQSGDNPPPIHMAACYKSGKVYFCGTAGKANCLDAETGKLLWQVDIPIARKYWLGVHETCKNSGMLPDKRRGGFAGCVNPCIAAGVFIVHDSNGGLVGLDLHTGKSNWHLPQTIAPRSSPVVWKTGAKEYVISCYARDHSAVCIDAENGSIRWRQHKVRNAATPTLAGDILFTGGHISKIKNQHGKGKHGYEGYGIAAWKLSPNGCESLWQLPMTVRINNHAGMTVQGEHLYVNAATSEPSFRGKATPSMHCIDIATGQIVSKIEGAGNAYASLVSSDRVIVHNTGRHFIMYAAEAANLRRLGTALPFTAGDSITPILVDGILYVRGHKQLAAFELRQ